MSYISYGVRDKKKSAGMPGKKKSAALLAAEVYTQIIDARQKGEFSELAEMLQGSPLPVKQKIPRVMKPMLDADRRRGYEHKAFEEGHGRKKAKELKAELEALSRRGMYICILSRFLFLKFC